MSTIMLILIIVHVSAVMAKLAIFFIIPRLRDVEQVRATLVAYKPFERTADWVLWLTGAGLVYFANWKMLTQAWMLASIGLYLIVFIAIRFALTREMEKISTSKKLHAQAELKRLRFNNLCVSTTAVAFLGIIAYLMITKP